MKSYKAPGLDNITGAIIKIFSHKAIVMITKIINGILLTNYFPCKWKIAKVTPILKSDKNMTIPSGYRPISLLPYLSKLTEKIIKNRLNNHIYANKLIANDQFGFRTNHSTVDQLARLVNEITSNFNNRKHTGSVFLDLEKAFDNVWHKGLIYKLIKLNFPPYLILLIESYLKDRKMVVEINVLIQMLMMYI